MSAWNWKGLQAMIWIDICPRMCIINLSPMAGRWLVFDWAKKRVSLSLHMRHSGDTSPYCSLS